MIIKDHNLITNNIINYYIYIYKYISLISQTELKSNVKIYIYYIKKYLKNIYMYIYFFSR